MKTAEYIVVGCAIMAGGVIGALITARLPDRSAPPGPASSAVANDRAAELARLRVLEEKVAVLSQAPTVAGSGVSPVASASTEVPSQQGTSAWVSGVQSADTSEYDTLLAAHEKAFKDPSWSTATTAALRGDLTKWPDGKAPFEMVSVDCRTSTCVAEIEFPTYGDAVRKFKTAIDRMYSVNCATSIVIHPTSAPGVPYREKLLFDCAEAKYNPQSL